MNLGRSNYRGRSRYILLQLRASQLQDSRPRYGHRSRYSSTTQVNLCKSIACSRLLYMFTSRPPASFRLESIYDTSDSRSSHPSFCYFDHVTSPPLICDTTLRIKLIQPSSQRYYDMIIDFHYTGSCMMITEIPPTLPKISC
jgi:hypothetical protein